MMEDFSSDLAGKYLPYLVEIRRRLFFVVGLFVIGTVLGFFYYERVIKLILQIFHFQGVNIVFTSPFQFIELAINSSLLIGLLITLPVIVIQILAFLKPALQKREYRAVVTLIPASLVLFLIGFVYGFLMMRSTLEIFYRQATELGVGNFLDVNHFLSVTMITSMLMGLAFEFPLVLTFALRFRIIHVSQIAKMRVIFYLVSIIFVIFLPPTDLLSDFLLELPLAILFELTLILNRIVFRLRG